MAFASVINVGALSAGSGFAFETEVRDGGGGALAYSDVDGDGYDDLVIGASWAGPELGISGDPPDPGAVYVIFGGPNAPGGLMTLSALDGVRGFRLDGPPGSEDGGESVAGGDVNGDGVGDLLIGVPSIRGFGFQPFAPGAAYVIYGHAQPFAARADMAVLALSGGISISGLELGDRLGVDVALADIDGDGRDDLMVTAPDANRAGLNNTGAAYVMFSPDGAWPASVDLAALATPNGMRIEGKVANDALPNAFTGIGDFNGDGLNDFVVTDASAESRGVAYVVFGRRDAFPTTFDLASLNGTNGFKFRGSTAERLSGSAAGAGDVNGDGLADLIVGKSGSSSVAGAAYVIFGTATPAATFDAVNLNGTNGFRVTASATAGGFANGVASAGDINGDGYDDVAVGHTGLEVGGTFNAGAAYVIFGKGSPFQASFSVDTLNGATGFRMESGGMYDNLGSAFAAGDFNGDGASDLAIGSPNGDIKPGHAYVLFGQALGGSTTGADTLTGSAGAEAFNGLAGADLLRGLGGNDRLLGGPGTDTAAYAVTAADYEWWGGADGTWRVKDLRPGSPEGRDTLIDVERLQFSDRTVKLTGLTTAEKLTDAYSNILRSTASGAELTFLDGLITAVNGSTKTLGAAITEIVGKADQTTAVAAMSYQFFLNFVPSKGGFDYLVSPQGPNPNNINSAYYQSFNIENRYINFAVNLGKAGEGAPSFLAEYGAKTLFQATQSAYIEIFGGTVTDAKINTILDTTFQIAGQTVSRAQYFALYGGDGLTGIGTKAAMVGWLLTEAAKADVGMYARSSNAFLTDLADGAQTLVDVVGTYGKAEYAFNG